MARSPVTIGVVDDPVSIDELTDLWIDGQVELGVSHEVVARKASQGVIPTALGRDGIHAYLARLDGAAVGYVVLTDSLFGWTDGAELAVDHLFVTKTARRHGVARQLLIAATAHAEREGFDRIVSNVPASHREANRFFARLGFSSTIVRRVSPTHALRRRLTGHDLAHARTLEKVLSRRRTVRANARTRITSA